ncbi:MAG: hypothetical protein JNK87_41105 [Bryobacterales bacterium]|nr:hypothetical protein [Bryobacterales bacterium]
MSGCLGPDISFPRRFVPRPETCSPFLCRPSLHGLAGCPSHGQPAPSATSNRQAASRNKGAAQPTLEELRREVDETNDVLARVMFTLRGFPDAAAAVSAMLVPDSPHNQPPRTTS